MPTFVYKAKDHTARTVTGRINAPHQEEALDLLGHQGLVPVSIEEESAQGVLLSQIREQRLRPKDILLFTKQISGLIKSGVPLLKSLEVVASQTRQPYFAKMIGDIADAVKGGRAFSACLADHPETFSPLYVSMVRVGEEMGHLREVLLDMTEFLKRQEEMSSKVRSALVYPVVMLCVGAGTVFVILTFVMPKIAAIFAGTGTALPWPTVVVMAASSFLKTFCIPILMLTAVGVMAFGRWRRSTAGQITIGHWALKVPFLRDLVLKADMARFARTMYLLLDSGLPLVRALEVAIPTVHNPSLRADLLLCTQHLTSGESLGSCLRRSIFMPDVFVQVLSVAEESGALEDALKDIAESCEGEVNDAVKVMTTMLEPLMILAVGLVVGFIVFAMLLPIFSMDIMAR